MSAREPQDDALYYIEEHTEPELLEMALKHTSFNAWIREFCRKAQADGVTVPCTLYIRPLARSLAELRAEMQQAVRIERAGGFGDTEMVRKMEWAIEKIDALLLPSDVTQSGVPDGAHGWTP